MECLCLYSHLENLMIVAVYRQPDDINNGYRSTSVELSQALEKAHSIVTSASDVEPNIIMLGDFNLPKALWHEGLFCTEAMTYKGASKNEKACLDVIVAFCMQFHLKQVIHKPTHRQGNILDLCFINDDDLLHSYTCNEVFSKVSHHSFITINTAMKLKSQRKANCYDDRSSNGSQYFSLNFHSEENDWHLINHKLSLVNWEMELSDLDVNEIVDKFLDICFTAAKDHVKPRKHSLRKNHIPVERGRLMSKRSRIHKQLNNTYTSVPNCTRSKLQKKLFKLEKRLMKSYKKTRKYEESKALGAIKRNPKYVFTFAKKKSKVHTTLLLVHFGILQTIDLSMTEKKWLKYLPSNLLQFIVHLSLLLKLLLISFHSILYLLYMILYYLRMISLMVLTVPK